MKYQILTHPNAATLGEMVNDQIAEGWKPFGALSMSATAIQQQGIGGSQIGYATLYAQAMTHGDRLPFTLADANRNG